MPSPRDILIEPEAWGEDLIAAREPAPRSLLMSGDASIGKTSFLRLLARQLAADGWEVFEAGSADLMAGQQWFGQLEARIQRSIDELAASKKLIWYIPDILQIALSGTHQGQAASILDQILPAVSSGRLIVWTEASPTGTARLLRLRPALEVSARSRAAGRPDAGRDPGARRSPRATSLQRARRDDRAGLRGGRGQHRAPVLEHIELPRRRARPDQAHRGPRRQGRRAHRRTSGDRHPCPAHRPAGVHPRHQERVNLASLREHFSARVIGQNEAITAVVERIAMLKAGLNDPGKPIGVFLFAGPTGTGKTELAKVLSDFLFGSVERLIRLDMSEFQTPESTSKVLGSPEAPVATDSLINRVRKQPFSVILLDEFEKAHANIWDLFLQVFDDGRLTDRSATSPTSATPSSFSPPTSARQRIAARASASARPRPTPSPASRSCAPSARPSGRSSRTNSIR